MVTMRAGLGQAPQCPGCPRPAWAWATPAESRAHEMSQSRKGETVGAGMWQGPCSSSSASLQLTHLGPAPAAWELLLWGAIGFIVLRCAGQQHCTRTEGSNHLLEKQNLLSPR